MTSSMTLVLCMLERVFCSIEMSVIIGDAVACWLTCSCCDGIMMNLSQPPVNHTAT